MHRRTYWSYFSIAMLGKEQANLAKFLLVNALSVESIVACTELAVQTCYRRLANMVALTRIYLSSIVVLFTVTRCTSRCHGGQQAYQPYQPSMDVVHVGDACSCGKPLSFDVEAPRPKQSDSLKEYSFRVEAPDLEDAREEPHYNYHFEVEVPVDEGSPAPGPEYGFMVEVPITADPVQLHSYGLDVHVPKQDMQRQNLEYHFHIDKMAVKRKDCCVLDD